MRLAAALAVAAAVLAAGSAAAEQPVLGIDWNARTLAWYDAGTLQRLPGRGSAPMPGTTCAFAFSPDGSAFAGTSCGDNGEPMTLRLVDLRKMAVLAQIRPAAHVYTWVDGVAWLGVNRLVAVADHSAGSDALLVDPVARKLVQTVPLPGPAWTAAAAGDRLAVLIGRHGSFGAARVAVVDADGGVRAVTLGRVSIGSNQRPGKVKGEPVFQRRDPGFAVDAAGGRAFVVAANLTVAEVDLATLAVQYHPLVHRTLQKSIEGPSRPARWLGNGLLLVGGGDWHVHGRASTLKPVGLRLVDTRDWSPRTIDARSAWFDAGSGVIGVDGGGDPRAYTVYATDGRRLWQTKLAQDEWISLGAGNAYLCGGELLLRVLDPQTGATRYKAPAGAPCVRLLD